MGNDRYFMLTQKPHYIIKNFSDDDKEKVCWVCLRIFKQTGHLKNHWAHTNHEAFTQMQNDGHAMSNTDCNKHFKEIIFPILTHTRALPHFYFTEHHNKLDKNTLHTHTHQSTSALLFYRTPQQIGQKHTTYTHTPEHFRAFILQNTTTNWTKTHYIHTH